MMEAHDRLKLAREKAGFSTAAEAAERFGWRPSTYHGHENGTRGLRPAVASQYARAFRVSAEWLLFGQGEPDTSSPEPDKGDDLVPVYDVEVSAGNGLIPSENEWPVDHLSFPPGYLRHITSAPVRNLAIVTVRGDSMAPTLHDKDVVMIDTTKRSLAYDGLFVLNLDGALHVKRITRGNRSGMIRIMADNRETYPPYERAMEEVEAVGKVLWYGRKE